MASIGAIAKRYLTSKVSGASGASEADWQLGAMLAELDGKEISGDFAKNAATVNSYRPSQLEETTVNRLIDETIRRADAGEITIEERDEILGVFEAIGKGLELLGQIKSKTAAGKKAAKSVLASVKAAVGKAGETAQAKSAQLTRYARNKAEEATIKAKVLKIKTTEAAKGKKANIFNDYGHSWEEYLTNNPSKAKLTTIINGKPKIREVGTASKLGFAKLRKFTQRAKVGTDLPQYGLYKGQFHLPTKKYYTYMAEIAPETRKDNNENEEGESLENTGNTGSAAAGSGSKRGGARRRHKTRRHKRRRSHKTRRH